MRTYLLLVALAVAAGAARERSWERTRGSQDDDFGVSDRQRSRLNPLTASENPSTNYIRIKTEILRLNNDGGIKSNGASCDVFGTCDPVCYANLDTERPNADWPGAKPDTTWMTVFGVDDNNSPIINVAIHKDICGAAYHEANLRVKCMDRDPATKDDLINEFDCPINRLPSRTESAKDWSPITNCLPRHVPDKMGLTFRYQVYRIPKSECNATLAR
ncbi:hypothetical protein RvY_10575 [Ramazzottius varieornatus]|uniref:Uncharacterized protein n=1 Tax=Ramazzottius varieornatus TaxID=947166 RepID=A0A1D1VHQ1_RAMVA|nr:hypothetical protein RvY_10575 [Ramazzottius varieornatus]